MSVQLRFSEVIVSEGYCRKCTHMKADVDALLGSL